MTQAIATRHGTLHYSVQGRGPQLFLLPANGHDARDFDAVRPALAEHFETLAFDWPAMGSSPPLAPPLRASAPVLADMLEDAVDALARGRVYLMGHSVGGFAAARFAARRPGAVAGLVLVDSGGFLPMGLKERFFCRVKGTAFATRAGEGAFARFHTRERNAHVAAMFARIDAARARPDYAVTVGDVWRSFSGPDHQLAARASSIACPTLLVWGRHDPVLPLDPAGRAAQASIPGARLVTLSCGHSAFVELPSAFLEEVMPFLRRTSQPVAAHAL